MTGFVGNIEELALANKYFRQVIYTGQHTQLVLMNLKPGEDIGLEVHEIVDQFLRIEQGVGRVEINGESHEIKKDFAIIVPAGAKHNIFNTSSDKDLKIYTLYSPPHHKDGTIHNTKLKAEKDTEDHI